ncbi:uncharacterized protein LOC121258681 [Juglans microcarpa x Juglans regia]|uniref:uncharacterized protein LOC121258681 n=1 Tax=Juglans microcarpa x Juglans regia TaxID=2249226 RepID=UPI001B7F420D|nr:uncharacterized protein LOC121258681 [Juglans microcarpa x Juglans regia]
MKLLDAEIIYPISDSASVSPVKVVPKKGGITMIKNDNNELILTSPITGWCMPFGLCNASAIFQRCVMSIFSDMVEKQQEVFMDDFSVQRWSSTPIAQLLNT